MTVIPINTDITTNLPNEITIKDQNENIKILSLNGKAIITNTLILSKTSFLSNIFPIDTKTTLSIQNKIFQYIWRNKQEPIARKKNIPK